MGKKKVICYICEKEILPEQKSFSCWFRGGGRRRHVPNCTRPELKKK